MRSSIAAAPFYTAARFGGSFYRSRPAATASGDAITKGYAMKLGDLLDRIDSLDEDHCIFAVTPWSSEADSHVCPLGDKGEPPPELISKGYVYFLEVHVAKEVLEVLSGRVATPEQKRNLLLFYAEKDAYPPWVYGQ